MRQLAPPVALLLVIVLACTNALLQSADLRAANVDPKVVLNVTVSTEWQPGDSDQLSADLLAAGCADTAHKTFLADLEAGMREFARYFYSYTGGQMAIGEVTIHTDGEQWDTADIRVLANRSYRPTAFVGGIVDEATPHYAVGNDIIPATIYYPGEILLSRLWDGSGARCGPWSAPAGWRTIGHEWGHYALHLYDEYVDQRSGAPQFCDEESLGPVLRRVSPSASFSTTIQSLMAYHYSADQLSHWPAGKPPRSCGTSPHATLYNESNWATVARVYGGAGVTMPRTAPASRTDAPPITVNIATAATPRANTTAAVRLSPLSSRKLVGQAYLIRSNSPGGPPSRIIGQGNILPGEELPMQFWGVQTDTQDRAAVVVNDLLGGPQCSYPLDYRSPAGSAPLHTDRLNTLDAKPSTWQPSLTITPIVTTKTTLGSDVTGLRVQLTDCSDKLPSKVEFVYCPAGSDCRAPVDAAQLSERSFGHTFYFEPDAPPATHGYIYAREPLRGAETMTWYQLAGGVGPTHIGAHAPQMDGLISLDLPQNDPRAVGENRVLYSPAPVCTVPQTLPANVLGIIGQSFNAQTIIANPNGGKPWGAADPWLRVRLSYDQDLLDRLGIAEERLVVLRLTGQGWQALPTVGRSFALDWIATQPQALSGQGDTFALGYGPAQLQLPIVLR